MQWRGKHIKQKANLKTKFKQIQTNITNEFKEIKISKYSNFWGFIQIFFCFDMNFHFSTFYWREQILKIPTLQKEINNIDFFFFSKKRKHINFFATAVAAT